MERTGGTHGILSNSVIYCTALYLAAQNGHRDVVKYISEQPIVPATDGIFEFTSVYLAAQKGNLDIFKYTFENVIAGAIESDEVCEIADGRNEEEPVDDGEGTSQNVGVGQFEDVIACNEYMQRITSTPMQQQVKAAIESEELCEIAEEEPAKEVDDDGDTSQNVVADQFEDIIVCKNIFEAAEIGDLSQINLFIREGIDVNLRNNEGLVPLHLAAKAGQASCVKLLIKYGANMECRNTKNIEETAIHLACENNHLDVALVLINKGADIEAHDYYKRTPLYYAAKFGSVAIVRLLLNNGADMNAVDCDGYPILSEARNKNIFNIFLEKGYNYKRITYGGSILHAAAIYDNDVLSDFIFEKQINVNIHENVGYSMTAIHLAARFNSCNVMQILLRNGANVQDSGYDGYNVLHKAIFWDKYEAVELLLKSNANINELTKNCNKSSLILAVNDNNVEITTLLLSYKADVKIKDKEGLTALDYARQNKCRRIMNILNPYYE